jgi:ferrous iron transport protein A
MIKPGRDLSIPLNRLRPGQCARIQRIVGRAEDVHRLEEFGFCQGTKIQMFRPGNPCIIRLAGSKVCLRADDLLRVLVTPAPSPC